MATNIFEQDQYAKSDLFAELQECLPEERRIELSTILDEIVTLINNSDLRSASLDTLALFGTAREISKYIVGNYDEVMSPLFYAKSFKDAIPALTRDGLLTVPQSNFFSNLANMCIAEVKAIQEEIHDNEA